MVNIIPPSRDLPKIIPAGMGTGHKRIHILNEKGEAVVSIRSLSRDIENTRPKSDWLHKLGLRKRVILQIKTKDGGVGYVAVNGESLRKQLKIGAKAFYAKENHEDVTKLVQAELNKPIPFKKGVTASKEEMDALNKLGLDYLYGPKRDGQGVDEKKAFECFMKMANEDSPDGYGQVAYCYSHGKGVPQDSEKAKEYLQKMVYVLTAKENAQKELQEKHGVNVVSTFSEAGDALETYAKIGVKEVADIKGVTPYALNCLGEYHLKQKNEKEAISYFQKGSELGSKHAKWNLAFCYIMSKEAEDVEKGKTLFSQSYDRQTLNLLESWLSSKEMQVGSEAIESLCQAVPILYVVLGKEKAKKYGANDEDKKAGFAMIQKAVNLKVPEAFAMQAYFYSNGIGTKEDNIKAMELMGELSKLIKTEVEAKRLLVIFSWGQLSE